MSVPNQRQRQAQHSPADKKLSGSLVATKQPYDHRQYTAGDCRYVGDVE